MGNYASAALMAKNAKSVRLWQEIAITLAVKILLLTVIWMMWFSAPEDDSIDSQKIAEKLFSPSPDTTHHDPVHRTR